MQLSQGKVNTAGQKPLTPPNESMLATSLGPWPLGGKEGRGFWVKSPENGMGETAVHKKE